MCNQLTVERNPYLIAAQTMTRRSSHAATFTQARLAFFKSIKGQSNFLCAICKGLKSLPEQLWWKGSVIVVTQPNDALLVHAKGFITASDGTALEQSHPFNGIDVSQKHRYVHQPFYSFL
jgi:hypothetical protein